MNRKDRRAAAKSGAAIPGARPPRLPPGTIEALFAQAVGQHQAGKLAEAESLYRSALTQIPGHPAILSNLADVVKRQGKRSDAIGLYRDAIAADPTLPEPRNNLGLLLNDAGQNQDAIPHFEAALRLRPHWPEALCNLAVAYGRVGRTDDAIQAALTATTQAPTLTSAHYNLGTALAHSGRHEAAKAAFSTAVTQRPEYAEAWNGLGVSALELGDPDTAAAALGKAAALMPKNPEIQNNLGNALKDLERLEEAENCCRHALALSPAYADAHNSLGSILTAQGRTAEAETAFIQALHHHPDYADAHANLGMVFLRQGKYAQGWKEYEYRWRANKLPYPRFNLPVWTGEDAPGKILVLYAEQGFGDTLQFIRFAPLIAAKGLTVIAEVPASLVDLVRSVDGITQVVAIGDPLPPAHYQLPLLSAPAALKMAEPLGTVPYLKADPTPWIHRLHAYTGAKVGLVWTGNAGLALSKNGSVGKRRSVSPELLAPFLSVPNCTFVSLQLGHSLPGLVDWTDHLSDFAQTAGLISALDLVIAVDTSVAHLAGALGKPVWVMSRFDGCWRWLEEIDTSPWYPTLRLYRQSERGNWDKVIAQVRDDLIDFTSRFEPKPEPRS